MTARFFVQELEQVYEQHRSDSITVGTIQWQLE